MIYYIGYEEGRFFAFIADFADHKKDKTVIFTTEKIQSGYNSSITVQSNCVPDTLACPDLFECCGSWGVSYDFKSVPHDFYTVSLKMLDTGSFTMTLVVEPGTLFEQYLLEPCFNVALTVQTVSLKKTADRERTASGGVRGAFTRRMSARFRDLSCGLFSRRCVAFRL